MTAVSSSASDLARPLLVICTGTAWTSIAGSEYHLARALTRYADVLWVDPPISVLTPSSRRQDHECSFWPTLHSILPRLMRLVTVALPGHSRPGVNVVTGNLVRAQIRWALRRIRRPPSVVVACTLNDVLRGWAPGVLRVLYGTDDYVAGARLMGLSEHLLLKREQRQLSNTDLVVAISPALTERWAKMSSKVILIPNGVQTAAYDNICAIRPASDVPLPAPVAGVVGRLSARINISLLEAVVDSGCSLLLVGPIDRSWEPERFANLIRRERVAWVGRRSFDELPRYLRLIDVGLVPYAESGFNRASFPLKTLEYLAVGLPVVSTDLPAIRWLNTDFVRTATTAADFAAAVLHAATNDDSKQRARRKEFALQHSWERRAEDFARATGLYSPSPHFAKTK